MTKYFFSFYYSARPVYLQERAQILNNGTSSSSKSGTPIWQTIQPDLPPERPPKKPHLRGPGDTTTPPITPPRGATPCSRPDSRSSSNATPPSRGTTPTSSVRGSRPKFPSPPGSPEKSRLKEGLPWEAPPPPPMETNFDYGTPTDQKGVSNIQSMPLPPPPTLEESTCTEVEPPTLR